MTLAIRGLGRVVKYGLKRIDYVNPANKLVSKYAPPGYRRTLFKLVKASEIFIGGKSAYDIYAYLTAEDTPGNSFQTFQPRTETRTPYKTRNRQSTRTYRRNTRFCRPRNFSRRSRFS